MKWVARAAWACLGVSVAFLLTLAWAYPALRPLRDSADANETLWAGLSVAFALAAFVVARFVPKQNSKVPLVTSLYLGLLFALFLFYVWVLSLHGFSS